MRLSDIHWQTVVCTTWSTIFIKLQLPPVWILLNLASDTTSIQYNRDSKMNALLLYSARKVFCICSQVWSPTRVENSQLPRFVNLLLSHWFPINTCVYGFMWGVIVICWKPENKVSYLCEESLGWVVSSTETAMSSWTEYTFWDVFV